MTMPMALRRSPTTRPPDVAIATAIVQLRKTIRWSQRELSRRSGVPQSTISRIEAQKVGDVSLATANRVLETMGARLRIEIDTPYLGDRQRQTDAAHAWMSGYVARRLERGGWHVNSEVEVGGDRSRGWIDLLAWHATTGRLLVVELKTEIHDLGQIDRTLGWYEREAWAAARRLDWRPRAVTGCLLLLMTDDADRAVAFNRDALRRLFPIRAATLRAIVACEGATPERGPRAMAMVDPRSKRQAWLRPTRDDGRRSPAPYADYADCMLLMAMRSRRTGEPRRLMP